MAIMIVRPLTAPVVGPVLWALIFWLALVGVMLAVTR